MNTLTNSNTNTVSVNTQDNEDLQHTLNMDCSFDPDTYTTASSSCCASPLSTTRLNMSLSEWQSYTCSNSDPFDDLAQWERIDRQVRLRLKTALNATRPLGWVTLASVLTRFERLYSNDRYNWFLMMIENGQIICEPKYTKTYVHTCSLEVTVLASDLKFTAHASSTSTHKAYREAVRIIAKTLGGYFFHEMTAKRLEGSFNQYGNEMLISYYNYNVQGLKRERNVVSSSGAYALVILGWSFDGRDSITMGMRTTSNPNGIVRLLQGTNLSTAFDPNTLVDWATPPTWTELPTIYKNKDAASEVFTIDVINGSKFVLCYRCDQVVVIDTTWEGTTPVSLFGTFNPYGNGQPVIVAGTNYTQIFLNCCTHKELVRIMSERNGPLSEHTFLSDSVILLLPQCDQPTGSPAHEKEISLTQDTPGKGGGKGDGTPKPPRPPSPSSYAERQTRLMQLYPNVHVVMDVFGKRRMSVKQLRTIFEVCSSLWRIEHVALIDMVLNSSPRIGEVFDAYVDGLNSAIRTKHLFDIIQTLNDEYSPTDDSDEYLYTTQHVSKVTEVELASENVEHKITYNELPTTRMTTSIAKALNQIERENDLWDSPAVIPPPPVLTLESAKGMFDGRPQAGLLCPDFNKSLAIIIDPEPIGGWTPPPPIPTAAERLAAARPSPWEIPSPSSATLPSEPTFTTHFPKVVGTGNDYGNTQGDSPNTMTESQAFPELESGSIWAAQAIASPGVVADADLDPQRGFWPTASSALSSLALGKNNWIGSGKTGLTSQTPALSKEDEAAKYHDLLLASGIREPDATNKVNAAYGDTKVAKALDAYWNFHTATPTNAPTVPVPRDSSAATSVKTPTHTQTAETTPGNHTAFTEKSQAEKDADARLYESSKQPNTSGIGRYVPGHAYRTELALPFLLTKRSPALAILWTSLFLLIGFNTYGNEQLAATISASTLTQFTSTVKAWLSGQLASSGQNTESCERNIYTQMWQQFAQNNTYDTVSMPQTCTRKSLWSQQINIEGGDWADNGDNEFTLSYIRYLSLPGTGVKYVLSSYATEIYRTLVAGNLKQWNDANLLSRNYFSSKAFAGLAGVIRNSGGGHVRAMRCMFNYGSMHRTGPIAHVHSAISMPEVGVDVPTVGAHYAAVTAGNCVFPAAIAAAIAGTTIQTTFISQIGFGNIITDYTSNRLNNVAAGYFSVTDMDANSQFVAYVHWPASITTLSPLAQQLWIASHLEYPVFWWLLPSTVSADNFEFDQIAHTNSASISGPMGKVCLITQGEQYPTPVPVSPGTTIGFTAAAQWSAATVAVDIASALLDPNSYFRNANEDDLDSASVELINWLSLNHMVSQDEIQSALLLSMMDGIRSEQAATLSVSPYPHNYVWNVSRINGAPAPPVGIFDDAFNFTRPLMDAYGQLCSVPDDGQDGTHQGGTFGMPWATEMLARAWNYTMPVGSIAVTSTTMTVTPLRSIRIILEPYFNALVNIQNASVGPATWRLSDSVANSAPYFSIPSTPATCREAISRTYEAYAVLFQPINIDVFNLLNIAIAPKTAATDAVLINWPRTGTHHYSETATQWLLGTLQAGGGLASLPAFPDASTKSNIRVGAGTTNINMLWDEASALRLITKPASFVGRIFPSPIASKGLLPSGTQPDNLLWRFSLYKYDPAVANRLRNQIYLDTYSATYDERFGLDYSELVFTISFVNFSAMFGPFPHVNAIPNKFFQNTGVGIVNEAIIDYNARRLNTIRPSPTGTHGPSIPGVLALTPAVNIQTTAFTTPFSTTTPQPITSISTATETSALGAPIITESATPLAVGDRQ